MLKNGQLLFFIVVSLLCYIHQTKPMEQLFESGELSDQPEKAEKKWLSSLKFMTALKVVKLELDKEHLPEEVNEYCHAITLINDHCDSLAKCINEITAEKLMLTKEHLYCYRALLYKALEKKYDMNFVVSMFDYYFSTVNLFEPDLLFFTQCPLTLADFCKILELLIKQDTEEIASVQEISCLHKIVSLGLKTNNSRLFDWLIKLNLLPLLDDSLDGSLDDSLGEENSICFFIAIALSSIDSATLNTIIDSEKHKNYDWVKIFSMHTIQKDTALHYATSNRHYHIVNVIIELIKDKNLCLDDFINIQDSGGMTPLMHAALSGSCEIIELLINNGANIKLTSTSGNTALCYALDNAAHIREVGLAFLGERYEQERFAAERCIELLKKKECENNC